MTVTAVGISGPTYLQIPGNGAATVFSFPFLITATTDLIVGFIVGGVYIQQTSGFAITGAGNSGGGQVTFSVAPPVGTTVDLRSLIPETQPTNFANLGAYLPESTGNAVDRVTRNIADLYRLTYLFGVHGPDTEGVPWPALPSASARANTGLVFDANGLPGVGFIPTVPFTQTLFNTFLSASALYVQTFNPLNYGAVGSGGVDDHVPVQAAFTAAGIAGGTVIFPPGYTFLCNADIIVPVAVSSGGPVASAQGCGWASISVIFGTGATFGFIWLGTGATTGDVTSSAYNYAGKFNDLGIELIGTAGNGFYGNSVNQPRVKDCWVRGSGTNAAAGYFINCLKPEFNPLVTGCGSATQGSVEFDACTTANTDGLRISGGVTTVGGLIIDRCTNFLGRGMSIESCGIPIRIGHKTENTLAVNGFDLSGLELENPGSTCYIDIGAGLSGGALVLNGRITAWRGAPAPTATVAFGIRVQNCAGLDLGSELVTQGAAPTSFLEIVGTNVSGIVVRANRLLQSNAYPWVRYNGTQVKHAGCQMDWQLGVTNGGVPVCTIRGLDEMQASAQTGATPNPSLGAAGGFMRSFQLANGGATNVTSMAIQEAGAEVYVYHADGNSTYVFGAGAGQFITKTGINLGPVASGTFVGWKSNGTAWSQIA